MAQKKVYGLILPGKKEQSKQKETRTAFNIFGDEESDDEDKGAGPIGPFGQTSSKTKLKKQNQMDIEKAMMDDPTVYEYDEIYDDLQASKPKVGRDRSEKDRQDKKPRYITGLLKAAEARKKDGERRNERKVQKEREAEGEKYADKESFVTSAYKKKMLEMQEEEERERKEAELEALTDVTKQKDMSGFYRYLYRQTGDGADASKAEEKILPVKEETESDSQVRDIEDRIRVKEEPDSDTLRPKKRSSSSSSSSDSSNSSRANSKEKDSSTKDTHFVKKVLSSKRNVRQKRPDSSSEDDRAESRNSHAVRPRTNHRRSYSRSKSRSRSKSPDSALEIKQKEMSKRRRDKRNHSFSRSPKRDKKNGDKQSFSTKGKQSSGGGRQRERRRDERAEGSRSRSPPDKKRQTETKASSSTSSSRSESNQTEKQATKSSVSNSSDPSAQREIIGPEKAPANTKPVDPSKKVYPHHNSPKDIAEARKRFLARKLERERGQAI